MRAAAWALCPKNAALVARMRSKLQQYADKVLSRRSATVYAAKLLEKYAEVWKRGNQKNTKEEETVSNETAHRSSTSSSSKSGVEFDAHAEAVSFNGCPIEAVPEYLRRTRAFEVT